MKIETNLNDVSEKGPLPGGMYSSIIRGVPKLEKAKSGKEMLVFDIEITDLDPFLRSSCFTVLKHRVVKSDSDGWKVWTLKKIADCYGVNYDEDGLDTEDFAGKEGNVIVERELYNGKEQAKIADFVVPDSSEG